MALITAPKPLEIYTTLDVNDNILDFRPNQPTIGGKIQVTIEVLAATAGMKFALNGVITALNPLWAAGTKRTLTINPLVDQIHFVSGTIGDTFLVYF